jgi:hypothetical protein
MDYATKTEAAFLEICDKLDLQIAE